MCKSRQAGALLIAESTVNIRGFTQSRRLLLHAVLIRTSMRARPQALLLFEQCSHELL